MSQRHLLTWLLVQIPPDIALVVAQAPVMERKICLDAKWDQLHRHGNLHQELNGSEGVS